MIKFKCKISILLIFLIFSSSSILALSLGKMQVNSKQDEPLDAVIEVIFNKGDKTSNLKPAIASKENYEASGLSRLTIHSDIKVGIEESGSGAKIFLISKEIVKDPFLDLLIQIDSEKGRVYKEYTVLLEPPSPNKSIKKVEEVKGLDDVKVKIKKDATAGKTGKNVVLKQESTPVRVVKKVENSIKKKEEKSKIVKSTNRKTLYQIARENKYSGVTTEQMVLAIFQNNPSAFSEDNVNTLIKNRNLKIPVVSYFEKHSHIDARKILRDQNIEWQNKIKKVKKIKTVKKIKEIENKDAERIDQLEKELMEAKQKLDNIQKLNSVSKNKLAKASDLQKIESIEVLKEDQSLKEGSSEKIIIQNQTAIVNDQKKDEGDGVFVSSISDINENKIEETKITVETNNGLETIHVLLLALFFVLLFGLFIIISRRNAGERNKALSSFVDTDDLSKHSEGVKTEARESIPSKKNYLPIADDD